MTTGRINQVAALTQGTQTDCLATISAENPYPTTDETAVQESVRYGCYHSERARNQAYK
jgi:hypothetical protein